MPVMRMITRLPGGLIRCVIGLAAAAVAVIGLTGRKKRDSAPGITKNKKKEGP